MKYFFCSFALMFFASLGFSQATAPQAPTTVVVAPGECAVSCSTPGGGGTITVTTPTGGGITIGGGGGGAPVCTMVCNPVPQMCGRGVGSSRNCARKPL